MIHGGISDKFTLDGLRKINRRLYRTLTGLPQAITHTSGGSDKEGHTHDDWAILMDCLWSDPAKNGARFPNGALCVPNDERGGGVMFTSQFTEKWLADHKLGALIRSHECQDKGYALAHGGKVLTLFSASNYYGDDEENDGAILVLTPSMKDQGRLLTYATSYGKGAYEKLQVGALASKMESAALARVEVCLLDHRRELVAALKEKDVTGTGSIKAVEWAAVMNDVIPVKLPWLHLKEKFVTAKGDAVNYKVLTDKLEAVFGGECDSGCDADTKESLYRNRDAFVKLFRILDTDASGSLSREEFVNGCNLLNSLNGGEALFEMKDVDAFMKQLDTNGDGVISFNEFSDGLLNHGALAADKAGGEA